MACIVLIEDDGALRLDLALTMTDAGHEVHVAANGLQGLQAIKKWHPNLVVSDVSMPHVDGIELRRHIERLGEEYGKMAYIFLSGSSRREIVKNGNDISFEAFIQKPVNADILLEKISSALEAKVSQSGTSFYKRSA